MSKVIFYTVSRDGHDEHVFNSVQMTRPELFTEMFPRDHYGDYKFEMVEWATGRQYDGSEDDLFSYDEILSDITNYGSGV